MIANQNAGNEGGGVHNEPEELGNLASHCSVGVFVIISFVADFNYSNYN